MIHLNLVVLMNIDKETLCLGDGFSDNLIHELVLLFFSPAHDPVFFNSLVLTEISVLKLRASSLLSTQSRRVILVYYV